MLANQLSPGSLDTGQAAILCIVAESQIIMTGVPGLWHRRFEFLVAGKAAGKTPWAAVKPGVPTLFALAFVLRIGHRQSVAQTRLWHQLSYLIRHYPGVRPKKKQTARTLRPVLFVSD